MLNLTHEMVSSQSIWQQNSYQKTKYHLTSTTPTEDRDACYPIASQKLLDPEEWFS